MIDEPHQAEAILEKGDADMIALARPFLADPRWPWRAAAVLGDKLEPAPKFARAAHLIKKWTEEAA